MIKFLPFWAFMALFKFGGAMHYALVTPYGEKFMPLWLVGLIMGGSSAVQIFLDVPAGRLMDKYGYLKFLKITTAIFVAGVACYAFGLTFLTYILSAIICLFGWLFFGPGVNAYVLSHATKGNAGKFMSSTEVSGSIGVVLSSVALPFAILIAPEYVGFVLSAILALALIMLYWCPRDRESVHAEKKLETHHFYIRRHFILDTIRAVKRLNPASGMLILSGVSSAIFYGTIWFVVPLVIAHEADGGGPLGIGLGVFDLSVILLGFLLGKLADGANKKRLVFAGLLVFSISGMLTGFHFGWLFMLFGFLATTGDEMAELSLWSWLHNLDKDHANDGAIAGVITLFSDLGWAIGPIVAGVAYGLFGPTWTIVIGALPILATWIIYISTQKKHVHGQFAAVPIPAKPHKRRHRS